MNESFEDENICTEFIKNCAPEGWIANTFNGSYYFDDAPHAAQGSHFVGLTFGKGRIRYFIRSPLLSAMRPGAQYTVSFMIRSNQVERDSVGILFTEADPLYEKSGIRGKKPYFYVADAREKADPATWQKLSFTYMASGSERFIAIGD
ncbi:MAG TPA: hypothetical protein VHK91_10965, partial [Flavisolibacter sp.]|nr:hypothetical protein [Flavisolibacter sp.]